jgi:glutamate carboxypeptidase
MQEDINAAAAIAWLGQQQGAMLALLEQIVNIDSGSYDKSGVDRAGEILKDFFRRENIQVEVSPDATYGEAIKARLPHAAANDQRPIVLMGHRDTVFSKGEASRRPFRLDGNRAYGPGVADMKAGLVVNAFVAAAFSRFGGNPGPLLCLVTSDEEIASPSSRPIIEATAREARIVFNSEPGRASGNIVAGRKGGIFMVMDVVGKAAHSGANHKDGVSAIGELAHKIVKLHALTDYGKGVTVNVGLIVGGQTVNTVAPTAQGQIDLRYVLLADRAAILSKVQSIVETCTLPNASAKLSIRGEFLPIEDNAVMQRLIEHYKTSARAVGFDVGAEFTGGCADSGFTAAQGCPTICGVGPAGAYAHSPDEVMFVDTMVPRAQAMAHAISRLTDLS